ncbi:hypothetical protein GALL_519310 [mine drainage metagenome]|uniref:Alpha-glycerophosphate oxidase C-terminal domain-containing protein n=1 Tax=mine drainage metagenome TaxID=410659 RepID=A0A1J5P4K9_9ZZZZ
MLNRYGSLYQEVLALADGNQMLLSPITPELEYIRAEFLYAVLYEGARSLEDVLARRTRICFESADGGLAIAEEVATLISGIMGWSDDQIDHQVLTYAQLLEGQRNSAFGLADGMKSVS